MITLHLREVLGGGAFGPVSAEETRRSVFEALGAPDAHMGPSLWHPSAVVWLYGDIEAHFSKHDGVFSLWMLWCDYIPLPGRPSAAVQLDPWLLGGSGPVSGRALEAALTGAGIGHTAAEAAGAHRVLALDSGWRIGIGERDDVTFIQRKSW